MADKKKVEELIKEVTKDNSPVESRPVTLSKKDMQKKQKRSKKRKKRRPQETGFICDDFEILI